MGFASQRLIRIACLSAAVSLIALLPGSSSASRAGMTVTAPVVSGFSPSTGTVGTTVSIKGVYFTGATAVGFNGTPATTFSVDSDKLITALVPLGASTGPVSVTGPAGTGTTTKAFAVVLPLVKGFSPSAGTVGTTVSIKGAYFTGATAVAFNGTPATTFSVDSDKLITALVPLGASTGPVSVTGPVGTGTIVKPFEVMPPLVKALSPPQGRPGSTVLIKGVYFTGATAVALNGKPANFAVDSDRKITAVVPAGATTGPVSVTGPVGTGTSMHPFDVVDAAPVQLWVGRYNETGNSGDQAWSVAVSPDGTKVFVTGESIDSSFGYETVAYDAASGAPLWVARYDQGAPSSVAVSPDGTRVFVTGGGVGHGYAEAYATVAYDAATGADLWTALYNYNGGSGHSAVSVAVSPDGTKVFVTGESNNFDIDFDYATVAYDAASGAQLWAARYRGPGGGHDTPVALAVSPDGTRVFVTGTASLSNRSGYEYATVAYDAASGGQLWAALYSGPEGLSGASSLAVSPDGTRVFVTGDSAGSEGSDYYATVAYDAAIGAQLWVVRYKGSGSSHGASSLGVSPDGTKVYVTGGRAGSDETTVYATIAYDAASGAQRWLARYGGPVKSDNSAVALAVSPDGQRVYVAGFTNGFGSSNDYATLAYDAANGAQVWVARYNGSGNNDDRPSSVVVSPDGTRVFVTGSSVSSPGDYDYATLAYDAG